MAAIILVVEVPEPWKGELETALRRALENTDNSWSVEMREATDGADWILTVQSASGRFWSATFSGAEQQTPGSVEARLREWTLRDQMSANESAHTAVVVHAYPAGPPRTRVPPCRRQRKR